MQAIILRIATHYLGPLLLLLSLAVLYRGHNMPGGGFIGGLMASAALLLMVLARDWESMLSRLPLQPEHLMILGLAIAGGSALPGLLIDGSIFTGYWLPALELPLLGKVKLGTPFLFDVGVYFTVLGFTLESAAALGEGEV